MSGDFHRRDQDWHSQNLDKIKNPDKDMFGKSNLDKYDNCPLCQDYLDPSKPIHTGPCGHKMHQICYDSLPSKYTAEDGWVQKLGQKTCPVCRYNNPITQQEAQTMPLDQLKKFYEQKGYGRPPKYIM